MNLKPGYERSIKLYATIILAAFLFLPVCQSFLFAQSVTTLKKQEPGKADNKKSIKDKKTEQSPPEFNVSDFTYTSTSRRDPFEAVYLTEIKQLSGKSTTLKKGYELEELKLVGIMKTDNKNLVMMEDMQGRGMLFKKNDYLNKNLWIADILKEKVEFGYKIKGEIKTFTVEIPRKKEGI